MPDRQQGQRIAPTMPFESFSRSEVEQSLPTRFEAMVHRYPDRNAIETDSRTMTYAALNAFANRIAHALSQQIGTGGSQIGLVLTRHEHMVGAILGVLKAGHAYVPLDPSYPRDRLAFVVEDVQASLLISDDSQLNLACDIAQGRALLNLDTLRTDLPETNLQLDIWPGSHAYVFYTSGSTGQPKGVAEAHRNVLHYMMHTINSCHLSDRDRIAYASSYGFLGNAISVFGGLLVGGTICPFDARTEIDLPGWLRRQEITVLVGSHIFRPLLRMLDGTEAFPRLRLIYRGAQRLYRWEIERYQRYLSRYCLLLNVYGATEANMIGGLFIDGKSAFQDGAIPVGYPYDDITVLILDENLRKVPSGQVGQIAIRSSFLPPGYWRRPQLTAERYIRDPEGSGERIYLTGDFGRLLTDGCLVHLGRQDLQVKVRGQRVDLSETEGALMAMDGVKDAVVMMRPDGHDAEQLVGYVVPVHTPGPSVDALRAELGRLLPEYMIPTAWVYLEVLPRNVNNKIDFTALPDPETHRPMLAQSYAAPRTPLERSLVAIWEEMLGVSPIGIFDEWSKVGGHSLLGVRLLARIEHELGLQVPVSAFFQNPTIAGLVNQIESHDQADFLPVLVPIQSLGSRPPLFLVHTASGMTMGYTELALHLGDDQPVYGLQLPWLNAPQHMPGSVEEIAACYVEAIGARHLTGPYYLGGYCAGASIALEMARQLQSAGHGCAGLVILDTAAPGSVRQAPLAYAMGLMRNLPYWYQSYRARSWEKLTWQLSRKLRRLWARVMRGEKRIDFAIREVSGQRHLPAQLRKVKQNLFRAVSLYRPGTPYEGGIVLLRVRARHLLRGPFVADLGWDRLAADGVEVIHVEGTHTTMAQPPNVALLARELGAALRRKREAAS